MTGFQNASRGLHRAELTAGRAVRPARAVVPLLLLGLALAGCSSSSDDSAEGAGGDPGSTVTTKLLTFEPETLEVKAGTTVTWESSDSIGHTVTTGTFTVGGDGLRTEENPDGLVDMPFSQGQTATFTFDEPGTYTYFCSIHKGMNGEIVVTP